MVGFDQVFVQLLAQAPVLIVYVVGLIMALSLWGRYPRPSMLTFLGTLLLLLTTVGFTILQMYVIRTQTGPGQVGRAMSVLAVTSSVLRAAGIGLLIAAVFSGRPRPEAGGFPVGTPYR